MRIGGTIDRMDKVGDRVRIVVYNRGAYDAKRLETTWEDLFKSPDARYVLQTLIYSEAALHKEADKQSTTLGSLHEVPYTQLTPHLYFTQKNLSQTDGTVKIEGEAVDNYLDIRSEFLERLQKKVSDIKSDTEFPMVEEKDCSKYCPFRLLCHREVV